MGWKNIKKHYDIGHIIQIGDEGIIYIGSSYVPKLIIVNPKGEVSWGSLGSSQNDDLSRYYKDMTADKQRLLELWNAPDVFEKSIPIYCCKEGMILEYYCEEFGYPNITHDGQLMYEGSFFKTKEEAIADGKRDAKSWIKMLGERVDDERQKLMNLEMEMEKWKNILNNMEKNYE